ncbi:hypothetical protein ACI6Q5_10875 [Xanthomonas codiaei]|uniref:Uncharacterized protein n=1 Tax=Xanthomonas codiaei TaxID=56463 RepID=A0A2S7CK76_9XANT|nr:hypothetical protein [Xanthomonas codiaei]PPU61985.1 hypothetical protein XcodCFBP4690_14750 [Xanthomonas codiaei]
MQTLRKIVLHSIRGQQPGLEALVAQWMDKGIKYVGVVGVDAAGIEELIDDVCVGDGSTSYFMLTAAHGPGETVEDAVFLAELLSGEYEGPVRVVEF